MADKSNDFKFPPKKHANKTHKGIPIQFSTVGGGVKKRLEDSLSCRRSTRCALFDSNRDLTPVYSPQAPALSRAKLKLMQRLQGLQKWKEEKEEQKKELASKKKKPFIPAGVPHNTLQFIPPTPLKAVASTSGTVTRCQAAGNKTIKDNQPTTSFAPQTARFKAPPKKRKKISVIFEPKLPPVNEVKQTRLNASEQPVTAAMSSRGTIKTKAPPLSDTAAAFTLSSDYDNMQSTEGETSRSSFFFGNSSKTKGLLADDANELTSVAHFRLQLAEQVERLSATTAHWDLVAQTPLPEYVRCIVPGPPVTTADLHGFWDLVFMQECASYAMLRASGLARLVDCDSVAPLPPTPSIDLTATPGRSILKQPFDMANDLSDPENNLSVPVNVESAPINVESAPTNVESAPTNDVSAPTNNASDTANDFSAPTNDASDPKKDLSDYKVVRQEAADNIVFSPVKTRSRRKRLAAAQTEGKKTKQRKKDLEEKDITEEAITPSRSTNDASDPKKDLSDYKVVRQEAADNIVFSPVKTRSRRKRLAAAQTEGKKTKQRKKDLEEKDITEEAITPSRSTNDASDPKKDLSDYKVVRQEAADNIVFSPVKTRSRRKRLAAAQTEGKKTKQRKKDLEEKDITEEAITPSRSTNDASDPKKDLSDYKVVRQEAADNIVFSPVKTRSRRKRVAAAQTEGKKTQQRRKDLEDKDITEEAITPSRSTRNRKLK